ncbi:ccr4-associated factor, putative [Perkinsus marinus ATCC 50983]|uniref:Ccr4-associated factor, putative n=1 Tax=Perkinsus marinus (strain ATCC 50983 / TXsc) TaxID=423536 RepID=C5L720_PERM5|nr:ccr4-associated factor, putative [Perkinsus marinus ATCC 50983]EER07282.1 ccr4-associated factor, putative [Perkinsus marinus ATCC 50983]|eukprot:XP_002775466.1 ccr4-associated factor, putative [Perkinsus marinus ATCC 50983]
MKANVDLVKIVQICFSFADTHGNCASHPNLGPASCCWKLNFKFNLLTDLYAADRVKVLGSSAEVGGAGVDFASAVHRGIEHEVFGEFLMASGIVLSEDVVWLVNSGGIASASLLKVLTGKPLPKHPRQFCELVAEYFPRLYDTKLMVRKSVVTGLDYFTYDQSATVRIIDALFGNLNNVEHPPGSRTCIDNSLHCRRRLEAALLMATPSPKNSPPIDRGVILGAPPKPRCAPAGPPPPPPPPPPPMPPVSCRGPPPPIPPPLPPIECRYHQPTAGPSGKLLRYEGPTPAAETPVPVMRCSCTNRPAQIE